MEKVTFEVETITPMFLAGNDQFETNVTQKEENDIERTFTDWHIRAEIRAASLRGLMRYWERALVGGVALTLKDVQKREQALFGSTDYGSKIIARVTQPIKSSQIFHKERIYKDASEERKNGIIGRNYLFWSMDKSGKESRHNFKAARFYYPRNTTFSVTISIHGHDDTVKQKLNQGIVAFWLLTHLGGIGSRSRRCAGSLMVRISSDKNEYKLPEKLLPLFQPAASAEALQEQLKQGINVARELYNLNSNSPQSPQKFDILAKGACRIWVLHNSWQTDDEAMGTIGKSLQDYRVSIKSEKGMYALIRRKVFGLPIISKYTPSQYKKELEDQRMASPLMLKVARLKNNQFAVIAVLFKTLDKNGKSPNYQLIEQWIAKFPASQILKVTL